MSMVWQTSTPIKSGRKRVKVMPTVREEDRDYAFCDSFSTYELRTMSDKDRKKVLRAREYDRFKKYLEDSARRK